MEATKQFNAQLLKFLEHDKRVYDAIVEIVGDVNSFIDKYVEQSTAKKKKKESKIQLLFIEKACRVLDYLNYRSESRLKPTKQNLNFIVARLRDSDVDEKIMKDIIDFKCKEWMGGKMEMYLVPKTLFNATNFGNYLNQLQKHNARNSTNRQGANDTFGGIRKSTIDKFLYGNSTTRNTQSP